MAAQSVFFSSAITRATVVSVATATSSDITGTSGSTGAGCVPPQLVKKRGDQRLMRIRTVVFFIAKLLKKYVVTYYEK